MAGPGVASDAWGGGGGIRLALYRPPRHHLVAFPQEEKQAQRVRVGQSGGWDQNSGLSGSRELVFAVFSPTPLTFFPSGQGCLIGISGVYFSIWFP